MLLDHVSGLDGSNCAAQSAAGTVLVTGLHPAVVKLQNHRMNTRRASIALIALLALMLGNSVRAADDTAIQAAVRAVLDEQQKDWNAGNIDRFMRGYHQSTTTRFASGGTVTLGWQSVLERYKRTYSDKAAMGALTFSEIEITVASDDAALAFGRWHLKREKDEPSGLFTLLFRKTEGGWKIVHDHTSAAEKK